jgi:hypothetical protein
VEVDAVLAEIAATLALVPLEVHATAPIVVTFRSYARSLRRRQRQIGACAFLGLEYCTVVRTSQRSVCGCLWQVTSIEAVFGCLCAIVEVQIVRGETPRPH